MYSAASTVRTKHYDLKEIISFQFLQRAMALSFCSHQTRCRAFKHRFLPRIGSSSTLADFSIQLERLPWDTKTTQMQWLILSSGLNFNMNTNMAGIFTSTAIILIKFRVRGVNGLRVVDASVLPRLPSGPPNSVLVAMAERAADFIINKH